MTCSVSRAIVLADQSVQAQYLEREQLRISLQFGQEFLDDLLSRRNSLDAGGGRLWREVVAW